MTSWLNNADTYETSLNQFPSEIKAVPIMEQDEIKGLIDVKVTQIRFFKGQPHLGWPHYYAVNGESMIEGAKKIVSCLCTDAAFAEYKLNPGLMIFELVGGEKIPESWLK